MFRPHGNWEGERERMWGDHIPFPAATAVTLSPQVLWSGQSTHFQRSLQGYSVETVYHACSRTLSWSCHAAFGPGSAGLREASFQLGKESQLPRAKRTGSWQPEESGKPSWRRSCAWTLKKE